MKRFRAFQKALTPEGPQVWGWFVLACALTALMWSWLSFLLERQSVFIAFRAMLYPKFWFTALLFLCLVSLFSLLTDHLLAGGLLGGLPLLVLGVINAYKLAITDTALSLNDLGMATKLGGIVKLNAASLVPSAATVLALVLILLWSIGLWFFSRPLYLPSRPVAAIWATVPLAALIAVFWLLLDPIVLQSVGMPLDRGNSSQTLVNQYTGLPLGLNRALKSRTVWAKPLGDGELASLLDQAEGELPVQAEGERVHPNVILILSESFFDVTSLPGVTYDADPVPEFHALQAEGLSGKFYTRSLGYGTSHIELEALTGVNTHLLNGEDLYLVDPQCLARVPAVPQLLRDAGYRTVMLHMFHDGIYDREELMEAVGFSERYFSDMLAAIDPAAAQADDYQDYLIQRISGDYLSDAYMTDLIAGLYARKPEGERLFTFAISMENHTPHNAGKYGPNEKSVSFSAPLTDEATGALMAASQGCANASQALGALCDYFRHYDEPTVILFFGDHRPGLGVEGEGLNRVYTQLYDAAGTWTGSSTLEQLVELRTTDYLVWANDPSLLPVQPGSVADASSNYFGLTILDVAGVSKPFYWRLLEQLSQTRLMDTSEYTLGADHVPALSMPMMGTDYERLKRMSAIFQNILYGNNAFAQRLCR